MISVSWRLLKNGFWCAEADLDDSKTAAAVEKLDGGYAPIPAAKGEGISRRPNHAIAYALQDLAAALLRTK